MESVFHTRKEESMDTRRPLKLNCSSEECECSDCWWLVTYYENNFKLDTRRKKFLPRYNVSPLTNSDDSKHRNRYWTSISMVSRIVMVFLHSSSSSPFSYKNCIKPTKRSGKSTRYRKNPLKDEENPIEIVKRDRADFTYPTLAMLSVPNTVRKWKKTNKNFVF